MTKKATKKKVDESAEVKTFEVISTKIQDDFCEYSYEIIDGVGSGDVHKVKGDKSKIIDEDMKISFSRLDVHLAFIDDVFKNASIEVKNIKGFHNHEFTGLFTVNAFKLIGEEDSKQVVLSGFKTVNVGGIMNIESPKIYLNGMGGYPFATELKAALDAVIVEVEEYKNGKYTKLHEDEKPGKNQLSITDENQSEEEE